MKPPLFFSARVTIADINSDLGISYTHSLTSRGYKCAPSFPLPYLTPSSKIPSSQSVLTSLLGFSVTFIHTDVRSFPSQLSTFKRTISTSPSQTLDHVIAVAGVIGTPFLNPRTDSSSPSTDADPASPSTDTLDVNYKGLYYTTKLAQHYLPLPPHSTKPSSTPQTTTLTLMGSLSSYLDIPPIADYVASKYAARGIFRAIRLPMLQLGIRTNFIAPWLTDTALVAHLTKVFREKGLPVARVGDVVEAVVRCVVDEGIVGRAVGVGVRGMVGASEGAAFDLRDEVAGGGMDGGMVVGEFLEGVKGYEGVMLGAMTGGGGEREG